MCVCVCVCVCVRARVRERERQRQRVGLCKLFLVEHAAPQKKRLAPLFHARYKVNGFVFAGRDVVWVLLRALMVKRSVWPAY